jgi:hypothetical protein
MKLYKTNLIMQDDRKVFTYVVCGELCSPARLVESTIGNIKHITSITLISEAVIIDKRIFDKD